MKKGKKAKRPVKRSVLIALEVIGLLFVIGLYLVDVFVFESNPTDSLGKAITVVLTLCAALYATVKGGKSWRSEVERALEDKIQGAFSSRPREHKLLISALEDYNADNYPAFKEKLEKLEKAAKTPLEECVVKYFTAICFKDTGNKGGAMRLYREILEENPDYYPAMSNLSAIYTEFENYPKAIEYAEMALRYNSDSPYAYNNLAGACFRVYDLKKAEQYANRAVELKKNLRQSWALLSMIYAIEGDALRSKNCYDKAVIGGQDPNALTEAIKENKEKFAHHDKVMARLDDWKALTGRPCIRFTLDGRGGRSIIGGKINEESPRSASGKPMRLLAAIFCSELPENSLFPPRGVLRFYIVPDDTYGADFDALNVQKNFRVLFDADEDSFVTSTHFVPDDENFPIFGAFRPSFTADTEAMTVCDYMFDSTVQDAINESAGQGLSKDDYYDSEFTAMIGGEGHKLGGYPMFTQWDPRDESRYMKYDCLLLQIDTDYNNGENKTMFGDSGVCNFFVPREKLKNQDFSDVLYTWDCY